MELLPCARCRRHIDSRASECPFCTAPSTRVVRSLMQAGGRLSRAAIFAGTAACWTSSQPVQEGPPAPPPPPPADAQEPPPPTGSGTSFSQPPPGDPDTAVYGQVEG